MDDEEAALLAAAIELSLHDTGGAAEQPVAAVPSRNPPQSDLYNFIYSFDLI